MDLNPDVTLCSMELDVLEMDSVNSFLFTMKKVLANKSSRKKQKECGVLNVSSESCWVAGWLSTRTR